MIKSLRVSLKASLLASLFLGAQPAVAQTADLLSDRNVRVLVEEVLIADLILRSCQGVIASERGREEVQDIADGLARRAGYSPEDAAARLAQPEVRAEVEAGARRRLAMMGARPEDPAAVCAVASRVIGGDGVLGALLSREVPGTE
jgi:hypothetical protein